MVIKPKEKLDLHGPNSKHVQLVSIDNHVLVIKREYAMVFKSIKKLVMQNYLKTHSNVIRVNSTTRLLIVMCRFFEHYFRYGRYTTAFKLPSDNLIENLHSNTQAEFVYLKFYFYVRTQLSTISSNY